MEAFKIKAFTLIEVIVAMAVSSVIIGLASIIFLNFGSLNKKQNVDNERYSNLLLFTNSLFYDFETCTSIKGDETEIILENDTTPFKIFYMVKDNEVIRKIQLRSDTFRVAIHDIELFRIKEKYELISGITGNIVCDDLIFPLKLIKNYPRSLLFSINTKNNAH